MDHERHQNDNESDAHRNPSHHRRRRRHRLRDRALDRPPTWTSHHSHNPHHFVRDFAGYAIPLAFESLSEMPPLGEPKKNGFWLFNCKDFIISHTEYEIDQQLRMGTPDLNKPRQYGHATQCLNGSLLRSDKYFVYATEMVMHEVEKEIRKWVRRYVNKHGHRPTLPENVSERHEEESTTQAPSPQPNNFQPPPLTFADLDPLQREFLVAALSKRLDYMVEQRAGEMLERLEAENGTLWGIGHDDLVEMAVMGNLNLDDVRPISAEPIFDIDDADVDGDITHQSTTGSFPGDLTADVASSSSSERSTSTRWSCVIRAARGNGEEVSAPLEEPEPTNVEVPKRSFSLRSAEPTIGKLMRRLTKKLKNPKSESNALAGTETAQVYPPRPHLRAAKPSVGRVFGILTCNPSSSTMLPNKPSMKCKDFPKEDPRAGQGNVPGRLRGSRKDQSLRLSDDGSSVVGNPTSSSGLAPPNVNPTSTPPVWVIPGIVGQANRNQMSVGEPIATAASSIYSNPEPAESSCTQTWETISTSLTTSPGQIAGATFTGFNVPD